MRLAGGIVSSVDALCRWTGYIVAWATPGTVLLCFATVYLRYVMGTGASLRQDTAHRTGPVPRAVEPFASGRVLERCRIGIMDCVFWWIYVGLAVVKPDCAICGCG